MTTAAIPTKLSRWLTHTGWTTAKLAEATGYSFAACKAWRDGSRNPSPGARHLLAHTLGLTKAQFARLLD